MCFRWADWRVGFLSLREDMRGQSEEERSGSVGCAGDLVVYCAKGEGR